jgi:S1-C subfamily serine protease
MHLQRLCYNARVVDRHDGRPQRERFLTREAGVQPQREDFEYDLERALTTVVGIRAIVPADAFTAETLGTERTGSGVLIDGSGLVLTIGYLITEAENVWITLSGGRAVQGHVLGYDQETGFGLVQALAHLDTPFLPLGMSASAGVGDRVVVAAAGGRQRAIVAQIRAKQEFSGYWEYVLDEALFTAPAHPTWSGTALIGPTGELIGIGSLQLQQQAQAGGGVSIAASAPRPGKTAIDVNMAVPIDLLKPILDDLRTLGKRQAPPRPWLGLFATEVGERIVIAGVSGRGPARKADVRPGDIVLSIGDTEVKTLSGFFKAIWNQGDAGIEVPMLLNRNGRTVQMRVKSTDRSRLLKGPVVH